MSDPLFDRDGPADAELARLEARLAKFRHPTAPKLPALPPRRRFSPWRVAVAAAVLAAIGYALLSRAPDPGETPLVARTPYEVEALEGRVSIVDKLGCAFEASDRGVAVPVGAAVCVPAEGRALVSVDGVGSVVLEENSQLRVDAEIAHSDDAGYLVHLDRGTLRATIFAAPRLFQIGTPAGIAVDLGCIYSATVLDDGATLLKVETGAVSFEAVGRKVYVPAGAECVAAPGKGPSVPVWSDDPPTRNRAVLALDSDPAADARLVDALFSTAPPRATLSLFHLLDHPNESVRRAALERLEKLAPDAAPFDVLGDPLAREALRDRLDW